MYEDEKPHPEIPAVRPCGSSHDHCSDPGIPCRRWQNHGNHDIDTWEAMMDPAFSFLAGIPEGTRNSLAIPEAASARDAVVQ